MRLIIKLGLVQETQTISVQASAHEPQNPIGRWFGANLDLKTVIGLFVFAGTLIGMHADNVAWKTRTDEQVSSLRDDLKELDGRVARLNVRVTETTVNSKAYEHDTVQLNQTLNSISTEQRELYSLLLQSGFRPSR